MLEAYLEQKYALKVKEREKGRERLSESCETSVYCTEKLPSSELPSRLHFQKLYSSSGQFFNPKGRYFSP